MSDDDLTELFANGETETVKSVPRHIPRWDHVEHWELEWQLNEEGEKVLRKANKPIPPNKQGERGLFVMQWNEFDIYVYQNKFMLRWGALYYSKMHDYKTIAARIDGKWNLPAEVQNAIIAARAMVTGKLT